MSLKKILSLALIASISCTNGVAAPLSRPLVIAQPTSPTADTADYERDFFLGAKVYFDQINANGGIKGRKVSLRKTAVGLNGNKELFSERPDIIFGAVGDSLIHSLTQNPSVSSGEIPLFATISNGESGTFSSQGGIALRTSLPDELIGIVEQFKNFGITTFGLAHSAELPPSVVEGISQKARNLGIQITAQERLSSDPGRTLLSVERVAKGRPQAVIVIGDTLTTANFFQAYRRKDPGTFLCTPSIANARTLIDAMGTKAARGLILSQVVPAPSATLEIAREHRKLMDKFADEPASPATLEGFIAAKTLVIALNNSAETSAGNLRKALQSLGRLNLGGYELDFNRNGRPSTFIELSVVSENGKLRR